MAQNKGLDSIFLTSCLIGMVAGGRSGFLAGEYVGETYLTNMSDSIKSSFPFVYSILGNAKTSDGFYAYRLIGPLFSPDAVPGN